MNSQEIYGAFCDHNPEGKRLHLTVSGGTTGYLYEGADWADELIGPFFESESDPTVEGDELAWTNVRNGLCYKSLWLEWRDDPWYGKLIVACIGTHYGKEWGQSAPDLGDEYPLSDADKTDVLLHAICYGEEWGDGEFLTRYGIETLPDPTDDGVNFSVNDDEKFTALVRLCREAQEAYDNDETDVDPEEAARMIAEGNQP